MVFSRAVRLAASPLILSKYSLTLRSLMDACRSASLVVLDAWLLCDAVLRDEQPVEANNVPQTRIAANAPYATFFKLMRIPFVTDALLLW
jgi:hypothetical protein